MTLFPRIILLATDGSEEAELAARTAVGLASGRERSLLGSLLARFEASKKASGRR